MMYPSSQPCLGGSSQVRQSLSGWSPCPFETCSSRHLLGSWPNQMFRIPVSENLNLCISKVPSKEIHLFRTIFLPLSASNFTYHGDIWNNLFPWLCLNQHRTKKCNHHGYHKLHNYICHVYQKDNQSIMAILLSNICV